MRETLDSLSTYVYSKEVDDHNDMETTGESHMLSNSLALPLTRNQESMYYNGFKNVSNVNQELFLLQKIKKFQSRQIEIICI